ncbi:MAG: SGNH/GDSL hydrolase family protein [Alphaproteobacteria bacterium]|nr:SGNH/GDSL hydrolase family protein [Alphaproteobacteria bacterium]
MSAAVDRRTATARRLFWPVYVLSLLAVTLAGTEAIATFLVPSYPARDIRPIDVKSSPEIVYNDWALRDRPRTFARPPDVRFRSVLVGDSFLEGSFLSAPVSALVERKWAAAELRGMEAINFGVSATGPPQYHYRIKDVALRLKPDAILLAVYAGNDFVTTPFGSWPPPIAELPLPSLLGAIVPRTTWLVVNRLGLSEFGRGNPGIDGEFAMLNEWLDLPAADRLDRTARHMRQHYFPKLPDGAIREILSRGNDRLWTAFDKRANDREFLAGWLLRGMIDWETGQWTMPRDA